MLASAFSLAVAAPMSALTQAPDRVERTERARTCARLAPPPDEELESDPQLRTGTIRLEHAAAADWDVVVIGAGPAGSLAARELSRAGARVLLVEKSVFPRSKVCGGCLNLESVTALRTAGLAHLALPPIAIPLPQLALRCGGSTARLALPGWSAIARRSFDARMVLAAIECGAEFLPATSASIGDRPPSDAQRPVRLAAADGQATARGRVILAADGLNQASHRKFDLLRALVSRSCRIGMGAVLPADEQAAIEPGTIEMAVGRGGYVGAVRTADDRITVAAAIDPGQLRAYSAAEVIGRILNESGVPGRLERAVAAADWRGTSPLTRSPRRVAADNVLLLGDAAGYVEPFTGDGMAAALSSALAARELVFDYLSQTAREAKKGPDLEMKLGRLASEWTSKHGAIVRASRRRCRFLSALIRRPRAARIVLQMVAAWPALAGPFLRGASAGEPAF
jgi:menaquinone-9 beta-reductase